MLPQRRTFTPVVNATTTEKEKQFSFLAGEGMPTGLGMKRLCSPTTLQRRRFVRLTSRASTACPKEKNSAVRILHLYEYRLVVSRVTLDISDESATLGRVRTQMHRVAYNKATCTNIRIVRWDNEGFVEVAWLMVAFVVYEWGN